MRWGSQDLRPEQLALVGEALEYIGDHRQGLPTGLLVRLRDMLRAGQIRTRRMPTRARYLALPLLPPRIELEPRSLGLDTIYDWRAALAACQGEGAELERRQESVRAKAQQSWLFVAAALVHEGAHALTALSWSRRDDERGAYSAELRFLQNVLESSPPLLVANAARSLLADARRDAREQEGVDV